MMTVDLESTIYKLDGLIYCAIVSRSPIDAIIKGSTALRIFNGKKMELFHLNYSATRMRTVNIAHKLWCSTWLYDIIVPTYLPFVDKTNINK